MEIKHLKTIRMDEVVQNFDHGKFAVYDDNGKFRGHIFEHDGEFLTTQTRNYFPDAESAAQSLVK